MAQNRPNKPSVTLPDNFGGVKNAFSESKISNGYEASTPEIVEGGNLNYMLDGLFRNTKYMRTVLDYVRDTPVGKMFWVNSQGQMDYVEPAIIATDNEFSTGTATDKTPNVKQVVDKIATKSDDNSVVHKTGDETIAGNKTFTQNVVIANTNITKGTNPSSKTYCSVELTDKNGIGKTNRVGMLETSIAANGLISTYITAYEYANNSTNNAKIAVIYPTSGNPYTEAPASDVNGSIVTTINKSKAQNGYFQLGNGMIVQWGRVTGITSNTETTVTFPKAFSSATSYTIVKNYQSNKATDAGD